MANPQKEDGYTPIANEILDHIIRCKLNGTQFRIIMAVWRYTYGFSRKEHEMSEIFLSKAIGIAKPHISREITPLFERNILIAVRKATFGKAAIIAFNKNYDEWVTVTEKLPVTELGNTTVTEKGNNGVTELGNQDKQYIKQKENKDIIVEIVDYLNTKSGKKFSKTVEQTKKFINARLDEGRTFEDFKHVVDVKCEEWLDTEMEKYLAPSTLFRPSNFDKYINQKLKNPPNTESPKNNDNGGRY